MGIVPKFGGCGFWVYPGIGGMGFGYFGYTRVFRAQNTINSRFKTKNSPEYPPHPSLRPSARREWLGNSSYASKNTETPNPERGGEEKGLEKATQDTSTRGRTSTSTSQENASVDSRLHKAQSTTANDHTPHTTQARDAPNFLCGLDREHQPHAPSLQSNKLNQSSRQSRSRHPPQGQSRNQSPYSPVLALRSCSRSRLKETGSSPSHSCEPNGTDRGRCGLPSSH